MSPEDYSQSPTNPQPLPVPGWIGKLSRWAGGFAAVVFAFIAYLVVRLCVGLIVDSHDLKFGLSLLAAAIAGITGFLFGSRLFQMAYWKLRRIVKPAILILAGVILLVLIVKLLR